MAQAERIPMRRDDSYLYTIRPDQGYFCCGTTGDGRQVLMGLYCPDLVAFFFNTAGDFLGHESRHLEFLQRNSVIVDGVPIEGLVANYDIYDVRIAPRFRAWQGELDFRDLTIRVKKFSEPILRIGIEDEPDHFGEILEDPNSSEEDKAEVGESIAVWYGDGQFVLFWGNDYWLDATGEVVSS
jgi:hypothetical protein